MNLLDDEVVGALISLSLHQSNSENSIFRLQIGDKLYWKFPSCSFPEDEYFTVETETGFLTTDDVFRTAIQTVLYKGSILTSAEELDKLRMRYAQMGTKIEVADEVKMLEFQEIRRTLDHELLASPLQLKKLKQFLQSYLREYQRKALRGQENWKLPNVLAEEILSKLRDPNFVQTYGNNNVLLTSENTQGFCHSLMLLKAEGKIQIRELRLGNGKVEAVVDYTDQLTGQRQDEPIARWRDDFRWSGDTFVFGDIGKIDFQDSPRKSLFKALTNKKGKWVTLRELKDATNKSEDYIRVTIGQIEKRFDGKLKQFIDIPSTQDEKVIDPPAVSAYQIRYRPTSTA